MLEQISVVNCAISTFKERYSSLEEYQREAHSLAEKHLMPSPVSGFHVAARLEHGNTPYLLEWPTTNYDLSLEHYIKWVDKIGLPLLNLGQITQVEWYMGDWSLCMNTDGKLYDEELECSIRDRLESGYFPDFEFGGVELNVLPAPVLEMCS